MRRESHRVHKRVEWAGDPSAAHNCLLRRKGIRKPWNLIQGCIKFPIPLNPFTRGEVKREEKEGKGKKKRKKEKKKEKGEKVIKKRNRDPKRGLVGKKGKCEAKKMILSCRFGKIFKVDLGRLSRSVVQYSPLLYFLFCYFFKTYTYLFFATLIAFSTSFPKMYLDNIKLKKYHQNCILTKLYLNILK